MALTPNQTEKLQHLIDKRRNALLAELREDTARSREHPYAEHAGPAPDAGDESVGRLRAAQGIPGGAALRAVQGAPREDLRRRAETQPLGRKDEEVLIRQEKVLVG